MFVTGLRNGDDGLTPIALLPPLFGALLGAVVGSFTSTILLRWPTGRSIGGRSACDGCGRVLKAWDLVPILSFAAARGRCRSCAAPIDRRHLAIEIASALIGAVALALDPGAGGLATALLGWWLLLIAAIDLEHQWLPDLLTLPLLVAGLVVAWLGVGASLQDRAVGALVGYAALQAIRLLYRAARGREGMGGGDPKLLAAIGAWLGWPALPFVLLGAGLVGLASLAAMRLRGQAVAGDTRLPLGSLMAVAAWPLWLIGAM